MYYCTTNKYKYIYKFSGSGDETTKTEQCIKKYVYKASPNCFSFLKSQKPLEKFVKAGAST
jgi:N-acetylneuraminic acid mutarotase